MMEFGIKKTKVEYLERRMKEIEEQFSVLKTTDRMILNEMDGLKTNNNNAMKNNYELMQRIEMLEERVVRLLDRLENEVEERKRYTR
jgi:cell division protein ZapA (FtsZ GTPase activity inhibitor)